MKNTIWNPKPVKNLFSIKPKKIAPVKLFQYHSRTKSEWKLIDRKPFGDKDRDRVPNIFDCRPMNKFMQGKFVQNIPLSEAKFISVYHGTQKKYVPKIRAKGFKGSEEERRYVYLTPAKSAAVVHAEYGPEKEKKGWAKSRREVEEEIKANIRDAKNKIETIKKWEKGEPQDYYGISFKTASKKWPKQKEENEEKIQYEKDINKKYKKELKNKPQGTILKVTIPREIVEKAIKGKYIKGQGASITPKLGIYQEPNFGHYEKSTLFEELYEIPFEERELKEAKIKEIPIEVAKKIALRQADKPETVGELYTPKKREQMRKEELAPLEIEESKKYDVFGNELEGPYSEKEEKEAIAEIMGENK
jgi:hypothetical protein